MKDHDILPIRQDDTPNAFPTSPTLRVLTSEPPAPRPARVSHDRTTRLVADVLGTTGERAAEVLQALGGLEGLAHASEPDLLAVSLSRTRARLVHAAFELGRSSIGERPQIGKRLSGSSDVWVHMRARLSGVPVEEFWAIALDVRHRVVLDTMVARGSLTGVEVHPRDVFRALIKAGAAAVIFCHNHPSGDPSPSRQDIELTARLREVGETCGIAVLDHVVVGSSGYVSLSEQGWR
jgi:DNA repair protein RadC